MERLSSYLAWQIDSGSGIRLPASASPTVSAMSMFCFYFTIPWSAPPFLRWTLKWDEQGASSHKFMCGFLSADSSRLWPQLVVHYPLKYGDRTRENVWCLEGFSFSGDKVAFKHVGANVFGNEWKRFTENFDCLHNVCMCVVVGACVCVCMLTSSGVLIVFVSNSDMFLIICFFLFALQPWLKQICVFQVSSAVAGFSCRLQQLRLMVFCYHDYCKWQYDKGA